MANVETMDRMQQVTSGDDCRPVYVCEERVTDRPWLGLAVVFYGAIFIGLIVYRLASPDLSAVGFVCMAWLGRAAVDGFFLFNLNFSKLGV